MIGEYTYSELTDMHIMLADAYGSRLYYRYMKILLAAEFQIEKRFLAPTSVFFTITMQLPRTNVRE
jgi:hypothetical protein